MYFLDATADKKKKRVVVIVVLAGEGAWSAQGAGPLDAGFGKYHKGLGHARTIDKINTGQ